MKLLAAIFEIKRILKKDTFMFQHSYSEACFYQLRQLEILPLASIQRDSNFSNYFVWDTSKNDWGNTNEADAKNYWVAFAIKNWNKPFVGER